MNIKKLVHFIFVSLFVLYSGAGCNQFKNLEINDTSKFIDESPLVLSNKENGSPSLSLCYQPNTNRLFSVDGENGDLLAWDLDSNSINTIYHLNLRETDLLRFTKDCHMLYNTPEFETRVGRHGVEFKYFDKVFVWNTENGDLAECFGDCNDEYSYPTQIGFITNENSMMSYYETMYSIFGDEDQGVFIRGGDEIEPTIGKIEFIPETDKFVIAYLEGGVSIERSLFFHHFWLKMNEKNEKQAVSSLIVDPSGKKVARIWNEELNVWDVGVIKSTELLNIGVEKNSKIIFNQNGDKLIVFGTWGCQIWDLENKDLILEMNNIDISDMIFSSDNKYLIIGDVYGNIFIYNMI